MADTGSQGQPLRTLPLLHSRDPQGPVRPRPTRACDSPARDLRPRGGAVGPEGCARKMQARPEVTRVRSSPASVITEVPLPPSA